MRYLRLLPLLISVATASAGCGGAPPGSMPQQSSESGRALGVVSSHGVCGLSWSNLETQLVANRGSGLDEVAVEGARFVELEPQPGWNCHGIPVTRVWGTRNATGSLVAVLGMESGRTSDLLETLIARFGPPAETATLITENQNDLRRYRGFRSDLTQEFENERISFLAFSWYFVDDRTLPVHSIRVMLGASQTLRDWTGLDSLGLPQYVFLKVEGGSSSLETE